VPMMIIRSHCPRGAHAMPATEPGTVDDDNNRSA
jgi:hypothetical protein